MIVDIERSQALWIEGSVLCSYSLRDSLIHKVALAKAMFTAIFQGRDHFFSILQRSADDDIEISIRRHLAPQSAIATASTSLASSSGTRVDIRFQGDSDLWRFVQGAYLVYPSHLGDKRRLLLVRGPEQENFQELPWYERDYDSVYQGIVSVTEIPDHSQVIVAIQRDSRPILYDPVYKRVVRHLQLADRAGSPKFVFRPFSDELWASDYDTLVKLDAHTLDTTSAACVQPTTAPMEKLFVGGFGFDVTGTICYVARPFSGDVLVLDADSMTERKRLRIGGSPLDLAVLKDGTVVTQEWKTGEVVVHDGAQ